MQDTSPPAIESVLSAIDTYLAAAYPNGIAPAGVEAYLPLFFDATALVTDYLPPQTRVVMHGDVAQAAEGFWRDLKSRYDLLKGDRDRPLLPPRDLYLPVEDLFVSLKPFPRLDVAAPLEAQALPSVEVDRRSVEPLKLLKRFAEDFVTTGASRPREGRMLIVAESPGRRETLSQLFFRAIERRVQHLSNDPLRCGALFGDVEEHRRYGVGEPVGVFSEDFKLVCEPSPIGRESHRGGVVSGSQPAVTQASHPPEPGL